MRALFLALTFLVAANIPCAFAQAVGESASNLKIFTSSSEVLELIAKAKARRQDGQPLVAEPILLLAPYRGIIEYRTAVAPAMLHEAGAELMYVIDGSGMIVTGGKLTNQTRTSATNLSGTTIEGGMSQTINKGDFLIVPENTPHQITPTGGTIILMTMRVPRPAAAP